MRPLFLRTWTRRRIGEAGVSAALLFFLWVKIDGPNSFSLDVVRPGRDNSKAFVFYATKDMYACSVLVNVHILRNVVHSRHRIAVLVSEDVYPELRLRLEAQNATVLTETPPPLHGDTHVPYYKDCLLKLMAFKMHQLDPLLKQILVLDSDQLIMQNLDDTFDMTDEEFTAAPAYWLGDNKTMSSTCMLIRPSPSLWDRVRPAMDSIGFDKYDVDLINDLFRHQDHRLPGSYATINSHWENWDVPGWFRPERDTAPTPTHTSLLPQPSPGRATENDLEALNRQAKVVHFSAVGKPWTYDTDQVRRERPEAHPVLIQQWETWRSIAVQTCPNWLVSHV
ncbi:hypothetical protein G6O67_008001 [Ophiocordyceps sinensis]|uniref:AlphaN-acetylglucosamine transferase n=2 Tax=Ophiocordyceps sinensis TaxID=72228 RepID=A0A8H4LTE4_9HYPO|nr:alphaN-acetylglucosamine transferase [Ophiocordyceps sinensis CO18]KAF4504561.1 hypothetical protein G6O67_008001 [Ophiocordyceps sinensis]